jgi:hypothetical protein
VSTGIRHNIAQERQAESDGGGQNNAFAPAWRAQERASNAGKPSSSTCLQALADEQEVRSEFLGNRRRYLRSKSQGVAKDYQHNGQWQQNQYAIQHCRFPECSHETGLHPLNLSIDSSLSESSDRASGSMTRIQPMAISNRQPATLWLTCPTATQITRGRRT